MILFIISILELFEMNSLHLASIRIIRWDKEINKEMFLNISCIVKLKHLCSETWFLETHYFQFNISLSFCKLNIKRPTLNKQPSALHLC